MPNLVCRILMVLCLSFLTAASLPAHEYGRAAIDSAPSIIPDRIILTWNGDPATSAAVTWRTHTDVLTSAAEIARADASPYFVRYSRQIDANLELFEDSNSSYHSHTVTFEGLEPNTLYAYRVGSGEVWSEWFHFKTATREPSPFTFVYFGDAQNNLLSLWSRTIRAAYAEAPKADFFLHAGDLVNVGNRDSEWSEWFQAGGWVHATIPVIATPGNHEYPRLASGRRVLSNKWRPTFNFPENGPAGLSQTVYYVDFQGARIISLNTNEDREAQVPWLKRVLENNPNKWTFVTFHHPLYSTREGRDNKDLRELWKPLFDAYEVDLVLQGHDHTYGRGTNAAVGVSTRADGVGPVYVVSVSGPKMYKLTDDVWYDRGAENTQLYQVIEVGDRKLEYRAYTTTGELYDAFDLVKRGNKPNLLIDRKPTSPERRYENTLQK